MATRAEHTMLNSPSYNYYKDYPDTSQGQLDFHTAPSSSYSYTGSTGAQVTHVPTSVKATSSGSGLNLLEDAEQLATNPAIVPPGTNDLPPDPRAMDRMDFGSASPRPASTTATGGYAPSGSASQLYPTRTKSTTTTSWEPSGPRPELEPGSPYVAPEFEEGRIRAIAQRIAAPQMMAMRRDLMTTIAQSGRYFGNPLARAEATRRALGQYGINIASAMGQAQEGARRQYLSEYQIQAQEAMTNYQREQQDRLTRFKSAFDEWTRTGVQKTVGDTKREYTTRTGAQSGGAAGTGQWAGTSIGDRMHGGIVTSFTSTGAPRIEQTNTNRIPLGGRSGSAPGRIV